MSKELTKKIDEFDFDSQIEKGIEEQVPKIGHKYRYKELCEMFGEDVLRGSNAKKAQLARWRLLYDLVQEPGTKCYVVKAIYGKPLETESFVGRKNEYAKAIGHVLLMMCYENKVTDEESMERAYRKSHPRYDGTDDETSPFYEFTASKSQLYVLLGLCKEAFIVQAYNKNPEILNEIADYPNLYRLFEEEIFGKCKKILDSARNAMKRRCLLNSHETVEFAYEASKKTDRWFWRVASVEEENRLYDCKKIALNKMGITTETDVYNQRREDEYRDITLAEMREKYGIEIVSYRNSVTFWASKERVDRFVDSIFSGREGSLMAVREDMLSAAMLENNGNFIKWLDNRANYDWSAINGQPKSVRAQVEKKRRSAYNWKKWDDILIELYQGDEEAAGVHSLLTDMTNPDNEYANGELHQKYMTLREMMKNRYILMNGRAKDIIER